MAGTLRRRNRRTRSAERGKILRVLAVLQRHGEALEADLGFRGIQEIAALSCRKLSSYIDALIRTPGSYLHQALSDSGDEGDDWTRQEHLLALIFDQLAIANWQRTGRKGKGGRPKPISPLANRGKRYGRTSMSPEEVIAVMRRLNPAQYADEGAGELGGR